MGGLPEGHLRHAALADETTNLEAEADEHSETTMGTVMGFTFIYLKLFIFISYDFILPTNLLSEQGRNCESYKFNEAVRPKAAK